MSHAHIVFSILLIAGCGGSTPQHGDLLYSSNVNGNGELYLRPAGSGDSINLTQSPEHENNPVWSPDGTRILYQKRADGGRFDIWMMNADGSEPRVVLAGPDHEYLPSWHPDGEHLTYVLRRPDSTGVEIPRFYIASLDGTGARPFSQVPLNTSAGVVWLPDGSGFFTTIIADSTSGDLWRIDGEGHEGIRLTSDLGYEGAPSVSPDGQWVAYYHGSAADASSIEVRRIDGSEHSIVVPDGMNYLPHWTPDGRWLSFVRQSNPADESDLDLYLVAVDGSGPPIVLVDGPGRKSDASFRPRVASD